MKNRLLVLLVGALVGQTMTTDDAAAQVRDSLRNDFGIELLGKALIYSLSYQYMVTPALGLEVAESTSQPSRIHRFLRAERS